MSERVLPSTGQGLLQLPEAGLPGAGVTIRAAGMDDVAFMDALQRKQTHAVGWMPTKQLEGHVEKGNVLIAERSGGDVGCAMSDVGCFGGSQTSPIPHPPSNIPIGYLIACDRYFKREDVGIIYQMNIDPGSRRSLVAANLLKAQFERSAYGVRLYCCWCAQDLEANRFWEAMGFVPLAFRTGGRSPRKRTKRGAGSGKSVGRTHIFWQKRIRRGDCSTPWWYPSQTGGGALREDRLVLPIPPGRGWWEAMPAILPGAVLPVAAGDEVGCGRLPAEEVGGEEKAKPLRAKAANPRKSAKGERKEKPAAVRRNGLMFDIPKPPPPEGPPEGISEGLPEAEAAREKTPRVARKNDPRLVAAARELRDRYLDEVNRPGSGYAVGVVEAKYDVTRAVEGALPGAGVRKIAA